MAKNEKVWVPVKGVKRFTSHGTKYAVMTPEGGRKRVLLSFTFAAGTWRQLATLVGWVLAASGDHLACFKLQVGAQCALIVEQYWLSTQTVMNFDKKNVLLSCLLFLPLLRHIVHQLCLLFREPVYLFWLWAPSSFIPSQPVNLPAISSALP